MEKNPPQWAVEYWQNLRNEQIQLILDTPFNNFGQLSLKRELGVDMVIQLELAMFLPNINTDQLEALITAKTKIISNMGQQDLVSPHLLNEAVEILREVNPDPDMAIEIGHGAASKIVIYRDCMRYKK